MAEQTSGAAGADETPRKPVATQVANVQVVKEPPTPWEILKDLIEDTMTKYSTEMAITGVVTSEVGLRNQLRLWRLIQKIMATEGADFHKAWDMLLEKAAPGRNTHFSERYAFRFLDKMVNVSKEHRIVFERMVNLIILTCVPATRGAVLSRYDWTHLRRSLQSGNVGDKLTEYYGL